MNKKNVVVIGSGMSGRGYIGELLFKDGWNITFADIDQDLIDKLNANKKYTVYKYDNDDNKEVVEVNKFKALNTVTNHNEYIKSLVEADLIMTALYSNAFEKVTDDIVEVLRYKYNNSINTKTTITLGANYVGLYDKYNELIRKKLKQNEIPFYQDNVNLVESIILRVSSKGTQKQLENDELAIQGGNRATLQVNKTITKTIPKDELPNFFILESDTLKIMKLKIWRHNTLHCTLAFIGKYLEKDFIYESACDDYASKCAFYASEEGDKGLATVYGEDVLPTKNDLKGTWDSYRDNSIKDTIKRVGRDPLRKLSRNERFIGPALLCVENNILPYYICKGASYGFLYVDNDDENSLKLKEMISKNGIEKTIEEVCELDLSNQNEKIIFDLILKSYKEITKNPIEDLASD